MTTQHPFKPLQFDRLAPDEQLARSRDFLNIMRKRRTVREFSREPVPIELIENAIATAGTAPSGANQQPWTFAVVSNPDIKRQIRLAAEADALCQHIDTIIKATEAGSAIAPFWECCSWLDNLISLKHSASVLRIHVLLLVTSSVYENRLSLGVTEATFHGYDAL